jgi:hypothetical protein
MQKEPKAATGPWVFYIEIRANITLAGNRRKEIERTNEGAVKCGI